MAPFLEDWRGRVTGCAAAVVSPASVQEVSGLLRLAHETKTPVFPLGGNTGLCMGAVATSEQPGLVVSLRRMTDIRRVDPTSACIEVDAGVILTSVHAAADECGQRFPLHLGSEGSAQIGGLISTNAGGTGALRYGTMRDLVLGLEVVLADGGIWNGLSRLRKDNTGYDLKHLFIGAEGTLGIVTGASLKLFPRLNSRADAWVSLDAPEKALSLLTLIKVRFDTGVHAFELLSRTQVEAVIAHVPDRRCPFNAVPAWSVMIELGTADPDRDLAGPLGDALGEALETGMIDDAVVAQSLSDAAEFWAVRHSVSEANKKAGHGVTLDISVPVSDVAAFIAAADAVTSAHYPQARPFVVCHLGDGNVHYIPVFEHDWWQAQENADAFSDALLAAYHDVATRFGGSFSAEHGIGRKLTGELQRLTAPREMELFQAIKQMFDPSGILNPGAVLADRDDQAV